MNKSIHCVLLLLFMKDCSEIVIEQVLEAAPHKVAAVRPSTTHHENYQN